MTYILTYLHLFRWLAHYYLPVIRYWNPSMEFEINHLAYGQDSQIILHMSQYNNNETNTNTKQTKQTNENSQESNQTDTNSTTNQHILQPYDFVHDQLFEQIIQVEKGANAVQLQQELLSLRKDTAQS